MGFFRVRRLSIVITAPMPTSCVRQTTYVPYSSKAFEYSDCSKSQYLSLVYFVQIASLYLGRMLASSLPQIRIGFGKFSFDLNPGPFSVKEHVAIVLAYISLL